MIRCVILWLLVVSEFGRIAVEFLKKGSNPKIYEGAAREYTTSDICLFVDVYELKLLDVY